MKYIEATATIKIHHSDLILDLISSIFYDLGVSGVVIDEPDRDFESLDTDAMIDKNNITRPRAATPSAHPSVTGYFPRDGSELKKQDTLEKSLNTLAKKYHFQPTVSYRNVDEEDWAHSWKAYFRPVPIGNGVVIVPSWENYQPKPEETVIEIDPGMAFGTGTHPTTMLSIQKIASFLQPGQTILDIGTGSGILLIAAAKLGAYMGLGVDNDAAATAAARDNLNKNRIDSNRFAITRGSLVEPVKGRFEIITANILAEVILELSGSLKQVLTPSGLFIASGIIDTKAEPVINGLTCAGMQLVEKSRQDGWVCLVFRLLTSR